MSPEGGGDACQQRQTLGLVGGALADRSPPPATTTIIAGTGTDCGLGNGQDFSCCSH